MIAKYLRVATIASCILVSGQISAQEIADTIYTGGPILTIDDARPVAEAVAVKDGRILAVAGKTICRPGHGMVKTRLQPTAHDMAG